MKTQIHSLLLAAVLGGVAVAETPATGFVREATAVPLDTGGSRLEFPKAADGRLSFAVTWVEGQRRETLARRQNGFFKQDGWCVYIESPTRLWMFDGNRQLILVTRSGSKNRVASVTNPGVFETCPPTVWDALPTAAREYLRGRGQAVAARATQPKRGEVLRLDRDSITAMPFEAPLNHQRSEPVTFALDGGTHVVVGRVTAESMTDSGQWVQSFKTEPGKREDLKVGQRVRIRAEDGRAVEITIFPDAPATKEVEKR